ncbi:hypothetical protein [Pseudoalteromonas sp. GB56]
MKILSALRFSVFLFVLNSIFAVAYAAPSVGIAKAAEVTGRQVTYVFTIENLGDELLTDINFDDDLDSVFGSGNYSIVSAPSLRSGSALTLNASFDGSSNATVVSAGSLAVGNSSTIEFTVSVNSVVDQGFGSGVYQNQVTVSATDTGMNPLSDLSDSGYDPDANGNGDATDASEDDATEIWVFENPVIAVSLAATLQGSSVTFNYYIQNQGNSNVESLSLTNNLDQVFGAGNYTITQSPTNVVGSLSLNSGFDGSSDTELLNTASIAAGSSTQFQITVLVDNVTDMGDGLGVYANQVTVDGVSQYGKSVTDDSHNSNAPDPNIAGETTFTLGDEPNIGVSLNASVSGNTITLDYYFENFSSVTVESINLEHDLDSVFGSGNYFISSSPFFVDDPATLTINPSFDGSTDTTLFAELDSGGRNPQTQELNSGETAQIRLIVEVTTIADVGFGDGVYETQVAVSGQSASGSFTSDISDSGVDPDPNGNGNPNETGENDATTFSVIQTAEIGLAVIASPSQAGQISLYYTVTNLGNTPVSNITISGDLNAVFGVGNFSHSQDPTYVSGATGLTFNAAYNGNTNTSLINSGTLQANESVIFKTVSVLTNSTDQGSGVGIFSYQPTVNALDFETNPLSDLSTQGYDPDPNQDGDPSESDPTIITGNPNTLGSALDISVTGNQVTLDYYLVAFAGSDVANSEDFFDVKLNHSLDSVFGSGNYTITSAPSLVASSNAMVVENSSYDGSVDSELFESGAWIGSGGVYRFKLL